MKPTDEVKKGRWSEGRWSARIHDQMAETAAKLGMYDAYYQNWRKETLPEPFDPDIVLLKRLAE